MLPTIGLPVYELTIPSSGEKIKIRPFLVKEEKLLLIALESKDNNEIISTTKKIIGDCIVSGNVNVDKLPFFDVDYLFIALRAKSVGETIPIQFRCNNLIDEEECGNIFVAPIDISNVGVVKKEDSLEIVFGAGTIIKMKYPNYSVMKQINDNDNIFDKKIHIIAHSIDSITEKNKVYTSKDFTLEELKKWIESLTQEQYKKLENFVNNFPTFLVKAQVECSKCHHMHNIKYDNFESFFF
jgi:hypothetical protein